MGGAKKPTAGNKDKSAGSKDTKKKKDKGEGGPKRAEIIVKVNEQQAMKIIQNSKVVTVQDLARQTGVKISAANAFLKESANKGIVKKVGGYSGHHLYQVVSS
jgi:small subunit ribosomal protein S25e